MASNRPLHILVVDNDKDMVKVTTAMLECLGYSTQGETESLKALRTFSDDPRNFDLAIVEPVMPDLMGVELAVRFRRIQRGFPVMLYSEYIDPPLAEAIEAAGLRRATPKPLGLRELGEAIKGAVRPPPIDIL
jgi:two-component system, cell cycle sensor histidine kinase and response regulator CckA